MKFPFQYPKLSCISVRDTEASVCYADLVGYAIYLSKSISNPLLAEEHKSPRCVCIYIDRSPSFIGLIFACWMAGFTVVPLNKSWPLDKCINIIRKVKPHCAVVDFPLSVPGISTIIQLGEIINCSSELSYAPEHSQSLPGLKPSDTAYIIFTSGSTGEPKGVVISTAAYQAYVRWTSAYFSSYSSASSLVITSEFTFDIVMGDLAFALSFGTVIYTLNNPKNILLLASLVSRFNIEVLYAVPSTHIALTSLAQSLKRCDLSSLKLVLSGGDKFPLSLVANYKKLSGNAHFYNVYGPTECTINCFSIRLDDNLHCLSMSEHPPIGSCFETLDYLLIDDVGQVTYQSGELCVTGEQLMSGYFGDIPKSNEAFIRDPRVSSFHKYYYKTGDIAYMKNDLMYLKGRKDSLVKIKGYRVHPDEVTSILDTHPEVESSATIAVLSDAELWEFHSFVRPKTQASCQFIVDVLYSFIGDQLPSHLSPSSITIVDSFPLNQSGKIDRNSLANLLQHK